MLLDDSSMDDQVLVCPTLNAPVQAPLQHRYCFIKWKWAEWDLILNGENDAAPIPSPKPLRHLHAHVEIGKMRIFDQREISIKQVDRSSQEFDGRLQMNLKWSSTKPHSRA